MSKIFVMKRRAGIEYQIPVWNLGGFIETPISYSVYPEVAEKLDALLGIEHI